MSVATTTKRPVAASASRSRRIRLSRGWHKATLATVLAVFRPWGRIRRPEGSRS